MKKILLLLLWILLYLISAFILLCLAIGLNMAVFGRGDGGITAVGGVFALWASYKIVKAIRARVLSKKESISTPVIQKEMPAVDEPKKVENKSKNIFKKAFSTGLLRLHIVLSVLGGVLFSLIFSIVIWDFDEEVWFINFIWPVAYWLWMLFNAGVIIFNNNIISQAWLKLYFLISLCLSITTMILFQSYYEFETALYGIITFLSCYLILFSVVWILRGFQESNKT